MRSYDQVKTHDGQKYKGMSVGASHHWDYNDAVWDEKKIGPDLWEIAFRAIKGRQKAAPVGSGVPEGTEYHWTIAADQIVRKIDANHYETMMTGLKHKTGYKKPKWRTFSYNYPDQLNEREQKAKFLRSILSQLRQDNIAAMKSAGQ